MKTPILAVLAITLYVAATVRAARPRPGQMLAGLETRYQAILLAIGAIGLHTLALYPMTVIAGGINLGIFNALSLVAWFIATVVVLFAVWRPLESLVVAILPLAAISLGLSELLPGTRVLPVDAPFGLQLHVVLSIIAYGLFAIAATQAVYLAVAEYKLRHHEPIMNFLPPLPIMEDVLFQLTGAAFILLTLSLAIGSVYIEDVGAQHLAHKIFFSVLAWIVFAVLVGGHLWLGWRGRRAVKYVIGGCVLLAFAFFGSKFVLEYVLHRV